VCKNWYLRVLRHAPDVLLTQSSKVARHAMVYWDKGMYMMVSCSTINILRDLLQFYRAWTHQSLINSNLWSQNKNISEYEGFPIACYTPPMYSFCNLIVIDDGILLYKYYCKRTNTILTIVRDLLEFCRAQTLQSLININLWSQNKNILEYWGFPIASYTPPMDSHMYKVIVYK
jgi:hypothetical protein